MTKPKAWTPEEDAKLEKAVTKGMRRAEIARTLGRTKNSIIARANKLGFKETNRIFESDRYVSVRMERKSPKTVKRKEAALDIKYSGSVPLRDIGVKQCRYSQDEGADMMCCGKRAEYKSYCLEHANIVYSRRIKA